MSGVMCVCGAPMWSEECTTRAHLNGPTARPNPVAFEREVCRRILTGQLTGPAFIYEGPTPDDDAAWASGDECDRAADEHYDRLGWAM